MKKPKKHIPLLELIVNTYCQENELELKEIISKTRKRGIIEHRQNIIHYIITEHKKKQIPLADIGAYLGGKDHATVKHAFTTAQNLLETNGNFRFQYNFFVGRLKGKIPANLTDDGATYNAVISYLRGVPKVEVKGEVAQRKLRKLYFQIEQVLEGV